MKECQDYEHKFAIDIAIVLIWIVCTILGILIFGEHLGGGVVCIDACVLSNIVLVATVLAPAIVFGLRKIYNYWRKPTCPRCGSRKQGVHFGQLSSGEKVCGFCYRHYWCRGWRNLPDNPAKTTPRPVWFLLPFWGERGVVVFVLAVMSTLLVFLGIITQLELLTFLGRSVSRGIPIAVIGLICWEFIKIKWRQQIFRWQVEAGVIIPETSEISLGFFRQYDENDPREYILYLVLGQTNDRWSDVIVVKDIITGDYKNLLISNLNGGGGNHDA